MNDEGVLTPARRAATHQSGGLVVLVANAKGGCGKTTIATNLASLYAQRKRSVSLLDLDPQESTRMWLNLRHQSGLDDIQVLPGPRQNRIEPAALRASLSDAGPLTIMDSPAGLSDDQLEPLVASCHVILVPVLPSPLDIRSATRFLQRLMLTRAYQQRPRRLAVIANRTRQRTVMFDQLQRFLQSLRVPYLAALRDTQLCVHAAADGKGLGELDSERAAGYREDWTPIVEWLEIQRRLMQSMPGLNR